ncbi:MAG: hypothetical protein WA775_03080 [Psychroserpens sp.]|uniref:hypothetical protein n=1 Tax=Psychroserpens sp. TaxID=2020870 RepID=UPI003C8D4563
MTKILTIKSDQTQLDVTVQSYGNIEALFDLLLGNDISFTETLSVGNNLRLLESPKENIKISTYYAENNIIPATNLNSDLGGFGAEAPLQINLIADGAVISKSQQSFMDIAIQETGDIESLMELAVLNDFTITGFLLPGTTVNATSTITNETIQDYYRRNLIKPATAFNEPPALAETLFEAGLFETGLFE